MKKLSIAFLWHMHQPPYLNPFTAEYRMPWVYLHGLKDYFDMPALLADLPDTRATFNLVPSLIVQLKDYERALVKDRYLRLVDSEPAGLDAREHEFMETYFFPFPDDALKAVSPHYLALKKKVRQRKRFANGERHLDDQETRDLQVLFLLSWCGETLKRDPVVAGLLAKGKGFDADDHARLHGALHAFFPSILKEYERLQDAGKLEVSVSPYSHPILPLLYDVNAARVANPGTPMPHEPFSWPQDVELHLQMAQDRYLEQFHRRARGMWPSEGSVSPEVVPLMANAGLQWVCTDRAILEKALGHAVPPGEALRPYRFQGVNFFFRDTKISDLIGFTYASWRPEEAVSDFLRRLRDLADRSPLEHPVVTVAMDGENAWEHFQHGGYRFLKELYRAIEAAPDLTTVTFGGWLDAHPESVVELERMGTGSWIYGDFSTWIGDPLKNRAWEYLSYARKEVANFLRQHTSVPSERLRYLPIVEYTLRAESSDWFWWYGEGHSSINDPDFDELFRTHLKFLYTLMGKPAPEYLDRPIGGELAAAKGVTVPRGYISPNVSGKKDDYFEWLNAGSEELQSGALYKLQPRLHKVYFGHDAERFYVRVDTFGRAREVLEHVVLEVRFLQPWPCRLRVYESGGAWLADMPDAPARQEGVTVGVGTVVELGVPLKALFPDAEIARGLKTELSFNLRLIKRGMEVERFPWNHDLDVLVNTTDLETENWLV
jgi:alpha-amylase/alpha-mannosidase (GH57 family)